MTREWLDGVSGLRKMPLTVVGVSGFVAVLFDDVGVDGVAGDNPTRSKEAWRTLASRALTGGDISMGEDEDKDDEEEGVLCSERLCSSMLVPPGASNWFGRPVKGEEMGVDASMTRLRCFRADAQRLSIQDMLWRTITKEAE